MMRFWAKAVSAATAMLVTAPAFAQEVVAEAAPDSGDTAWILTASALVLMMTLPGLALFYGGLVRAKNFLSVLVQCGAIAAITSLIWIVAGYSLAFSSTGGPIIGNLQNAMFADMFAMREGQSIGELVFGLFQMTFAIITPALIVGAWVERARFGWVVAFSALWSLLVYVPVARWVWGNGFLFDLGVVDFAGGIVVHTTAGVSALVVALMLGKRQGFPRTLMLPHSPSLTVAGAGLLWVGWFGFNGGSALAASDEGAATAIIVTHLAASVAALVWLGLEKIKVGKPTAVGFATGAVAGLATITPASGSVGPIGAIILGIVAGIVCFYAVRLIKGKLQIDDSLDVFAVHGVGGIMGSILLAFLASEAIGGNGYAEGMTMGSQLVAQLVGVGVVAAYSAVVTLIVGYMVSMILPMRVSEEHERDGLDISSHGERAWDLD
ncbi:ammonium transporter [Sphingorhabdus sp.]|jgi:Amt family ammonium transporter|uniref:ammonium transporter n=2 Tax=Sphingorhabdus sp. TaxID=1902408 RepID=UPI003BAE1C4A|nr:ammonium transporter [Sphingomonadales bacterium]MBK9430876.1 ammonium transporter [Sphingomonadales bacterium]MBL0021023.1 ammonium transporter [Sphingomonadales bacterium]